MFNIVECAWMLRYSMANEGGFQLLPEESASDLFANRKRKGKAAIESARTGKTRRWCDAEIDRLIELLEERPCLWDIFCKDYHVQCLVLPLLVTIILLFQFFFHPPLPRILGRFWTQTSRAQVLNPTCCIRLATLSNTVQHRPTMLDSTMLDDVGSIWPGF